MCCLQKLCVFLVYAVAKLEKTALKKRIAYLRGRPGWPELLHFTLKFCKFCLKS